MLNLIAKGVIWDFDGTLFNSFQIAEEVLTEVFHRRGIAIPTHEAFLHNYHGHLRDSIRELSHRDGDELEGLYEEFILSEEHHYDDPLHLYFDDALDLLRRNHSTELKQIIVSNRPHFNDDRKGSPRNLATRPPLVGYIEAVVCGDDTDYHKPDARVVDEAEHRLGLARRDLVVLGDQFVDVELATNLGCQAVIVTRGNDKMPHSDKLPDGWQQRVHMVKSLQDVSVELPHLIEART